MNPLRILVTAVGGDLGQSIIKCLRDCGCPVHITGCDMNPYAGGRAKTDEFFQAPPVRETENYLRFLRDTVRAGTIDYVFPVSDVEILFFNAQRERFSDLTVRFVANDPVIIDTFSDKYHTVEFFKKNGLPYPRTWLQESLTEQPGFPLILKKRRGSGSQNLLKIFDADELQFYLKKNSGMVIQEYIPGDTREYTAAIFSGGGQVHTITFRRTLAPGGFSQQVEPVTDKTITGFPRQVAKALGADGSRFMAVNVQFRDTQKGCIPFEINPRFSSTVYLRHLFGFKDVQWTLDMLQGKPVPQSPVIKKGVGVRTFGELIFEQ